MAEIDCWIRESRLLSNGQRSIWLDLTDMSRLAFSDQDVPCICLQWLNLDPESCKPDFDHTRVPSWSSWLKYSCLCLKRNQVRPLMEFFQICMSHHYPLNLVYTLPCDHLNPQVRGRLAPSSSNRGGSACITFNRIPHICWPCKVLMASWALVESVNLAYP